MTRPFPFDVLTNVQRPTSDLQRPPFYTRSPAYRAVSPITVPSHGSK